MRLRGTKIQSRTPYLQLFYRPPTTSNPSSITLAVVGAMPPRSMKGEKKMFQPRVRATQPHGVLLHETPAPRWTSANVVALAGRFFMFKSEQLFTSRDAGPAFSFRALLGLLFVGFGLFAVSTGNAFASTTITGTVVPSGKYLGTGAPVTTTAVSVLKFSFDNKTSCTNLELCAGSAADFAAGTCSTRLSQSGGPGFVFVTITDTSRVSGEILVVL